MTGLDGNRLAVLLAVLQRKAGVHVLDLDVFASVAGGARVDEPAVDLALCAAVVSAMREQPLAQGALAFGEVGLTGELRAVPRTAARVAEARKLGFTRIVLPKASAEQLTPAERKGVDARSPPSASTTRSRTCFERAALARGLRRCRRLGIGLRHAAWPADARARRTHAAAAARRARRLRSARAGTRSATRRLGPFTVPRLLSESISRIGTSAPTLSGCSGWLSSTWPSSCASVHAVWRWRRPLRSSTRLLVIGPELAAMNASPWRVPCEKRLMMNRSMRRPGLRRRAP